MTTNDRPAQSNPSNISRTFITTCLIILLAWNHSGGVPDSLATAKLYSVEPVPTAIRTRLKLTPFYQKYLNVRGLPIVASAKVPDYALREAAWILRNMISHRSDILQAMANKQVFITIMAYNEYTTDVPEHSQLKPRIYWDRRARGLGGIPVSCGEENLLGYPGDPYEKENILIHEFAHCIHSSGLRKVDPAFDKKLKTAYERAQQKELWKNTYAITNRAEYWAEAVQCWFDDNRENDALHNHVNTRAELKTYDPELARLCTEVLGDGPWRYKKPLQRNAKNRAHLAGFDFSQTPTFKWRKESLTEKPRVSIQTAIGDIEVELDAKNAPLSTQNFIRYVHEGFYSDGLFFRTVRPGNQPDNPIKIAVIQAQANPSREADSLDPIPLERTRDTHLRHLDGALSMARMGPDSATHHFFICIGDQPELDFGGKRNPDGQGFAIFGRVVKGMDVARKIHQLPAQGQNLNPPVLIQRAIRMH